MPTFIMLTTLTAEGVQTVKNNPNRIKEVNRELEQIGAKVLAQWATLGRLTSFIRFGLFLTVWTPSAVSVVSMMKVGILSSSRPVSTRYRRNGRSPESLVSGIPPYAQQQAGKGSDEET